MIWGLAPLFWKLFPNTPVQALLAHRILSSLVIMFVFLLMSSLRRHPSPEKNFTLRQALWIPLTALLIGFNWWLFVVAVADGKVLSASLGYFLNPILNLALGVFLLKEKTVFFERLSFVSAGFGLSLAFLTNTELDLFITLGLASSFALYGFVRKIAKIPTDLGLLFEMVILSPFAVWLLVLHPDHQQLGVVLAVGSGLLTVIPLALFVRAVGQMNLTTIGALQYLAPSFQMLLALVVFLEPFSPLSSILFVSVVLAAVCALLAQHTRRSSLWR